MNDNFSVYITLDSATLKRRIENEELILRQFQKHLDLVNMILERAAHGTIDAYYAEWSQSIKDSVVRLEQMKIALAMKELG